MNKIHIRAGVDPCKRVAKPAARDSSASANGLSVTLFRFLLARWLGAESAYGHLAAASVDRAVEETSRVS